MKNEKAKEFINKWSNRGNEKQETQQYWNDIVYEVLGAPKSTVIEYEKPVKINGQTKFIDAYLPETKTLIEQKSLGIDLMKAELQSDGAKLTPYEQGRRYGGYLPYDEQPRWIIDCNFEEIRVHDMKKPADAPEIIKLKDMGKDYTRLMFLVNSEDEHLKKEFEVSVKAGEIVGILYDKLLAQYKDPSEHDLQSLNRVCVRIVFCLYAEDAGLFGNNTNAFHDYMSQFNGPARFRNGLKEFFNVLNQPYEERDPYLDPELSAFPFVNGGLFKDDNLALPFFTEEIVDLILEKASSDFDWSDISPTIFGAIFESTLNPETRRSGGMHYTSIENIHKVIDPLFLDDLKEELASIKADPIDKTRNKKLKDYQNKLSNLNFLDPACGSGNFLTESYLCLRRLENEVIALLKRGQIMMAFDETPNPIKVSIGQFYGIEVNDFACATAQTAMWIAEAKMMKETEAIVMQDFDFFPLTNNANIVEGNALRMDWNSVISANDMNFIMGNPPFVGQHLRTKEQANDMSIIWGAGEIETKLDYVICWYKKAIDYMQSSNKKIDCAFVSTNSICQGESVPTFWKKMISEGAIITFAHRTFIWDSEANEKAIVHCVIVGFTNMNAPTMRKIYDGNNITLCNHINPYLSNAPDIWISNRVNKPQNGLPKMTTGSPPTDDGALTLSSEEKDELINKYPILTNYIRPFIGAREFLHDKVGTYSRYCLWFKDGNPADYVKIPEIKERLQRVRDLRLSSNADRIQKMAGLPYLFCQIRQPQSTYLVFPRHSSQNRRYIPIGFKEPNVIAGDACSIIPNVTIYEFGVLTSNVHNAWMRITCGRIKSDFRYSPSVYNNFPWPTPSEEQKATIEKTAQGILDARAKYPNASLADLYDELTMPIDLRKAHQANDRAVMQAYGFSLKMTEQECVAELMKMYQKLTEQQ